MCATAGFASLDESSQNALYLWYNDDLHQADVQAQHLLDTMILQMAKESGATEHLKMTDQLRWVGMMNTIIAQVEEIIWNEIVYK